MVQISGMLVTAVGAIIGALFSIIGYFIVKWKDTSEKAIDALEKREIVRDKEILKLKLIVEDIRLRHEAQHGEKIIGDINIP